MLSRSLAAFLPNWMVCWICAGMLHPESTWWDQLSLCLYWGKENSTAETSVLNFARVEVSLCSCKSSTRRSSRTPAVLGRYGLLRAHAEKTA